MHHTFSQLNFLGFRPSPWFFAPQCKPMPRIPRHGYEIADAEDNIIGVVTSGTMSPVLKKGIGMGYVKPEFAKAGTEICIKVRGRNLKAQVVKAPFRK